PLSERDVDIKILKPFFNNIENLNKTGLHYHYRECGSFALHLRQDIVIEGSYGKKSDYQFIYDSWSLT
ncbi:21574_t:CDS:2, partial [Entrophospora sp. SA101]